MIAARAACPRCGRRLSLKRDGIFQWKVCPAAKACGWTIFNHQPTDAAGYDNTRSFEDWADEYGYDVDSRKAEALYQRVGEATAKLARFFEVSDHDRAPWMTEDAEVLARRYADAN